jgi:hypothetical protein
MHAQDPRYDQANNKAGRRAHLQPSNYIFYSAHMSSILRNEGAGPGPRPRFLPFPSELPSTRTWQCQLAFGEPPTSPMPRPIQEHGPTHWGKCLVLRYKSSAGRFDVDPLRSARRLTWRGTMAHQGAIDVHGPRRPEILVGGVHPIGAGKSGVPPHASLPQRRARTELHAMRFVESWSSALRCSSRLRWADARACQFDRCAHHGPGGWE